MLKALKNVYEGSDLLVLSNFDAVSLYPNYQGRVFILFSAWAPSGVGVPFGPRFFAKHDIPAFFVCQKKNVWWHTNEINDVINLIRGKVTEVELVTYGSSMGGYGAIYLAAQFDSAVALAVAPQIVIKNHLVDVDLRWTNDWVGINKSYDEFDILSSDGYKGVRIVMGDDKHPLDSIHFNLYRAYEGSKNLFVSLPYVMHDAARVLVKSEHFKRMLINLAQKNYVPNAAEMNTWFEELYKLDEKALLNYLRNTYIDPGEYKIYLDLINAVWSVLDFEGMYMAAEVLAKIGDYDLSFKASIESLRRYRGKTTPNYLIEKHKLICKRVLFRVV